MRTVIHPVELLAWVLAAFIVFCIIAYWIEAAIDHIVQRQQQNLWLKKREQRARLLKERLEKLRKAEEYIVTISGTADKPVPRRRGPNIEDLSPAPIHKRKKKWPHQRRKNKNKWPRL